jgi:hypothetical protein
VFVYERPIGGWSELASLSPVVVTAPPAAGGVAPAEFGGAVQLTDAGSLVVGAPKADVAGQADAGAAWTFSVGAGSATPVGAALTATTAAPNQNFGSAIASRGDLVAIGSPGESAETGALYVYPRTGAGVGAPTRVTRTDGAIGDKFGSSVGIGGGLIVAGSPGDDNTAGNNSGSATVLLPGPGATVIETGTLMPEAGDNPQPSRRRTGSTRTPSRRPAATASARRSRSAADARSSARRSPTRARWSTRAASIRSCSTASSAAGWTAETRRRYSTTRQTNPLR